MTGIEIFILIAIAGSSAASINHVFSLGKNIKSVLEWISRKVNGPSPEERRYQDIAPLALLIQGKLSNRIIFIAILTTIGAAITIISSGEFSIEQLGIGEILDIGVGGIGGLIGVSLYNQGLIRHLLSPDERAILEEYDRTYLGYIREKRKGLQILTDVEWEILACLPPSKKEAINASRVTSVVNKKRETVTNVNENEQINEDDANDALEWFSELNYAKKKDNCYYRTDGGTEALGRREQLKKLNQFVP